MKKVQFRISEQSPWEEGKFHQWGMINTYQEIVETRAIIETKDGTIVIIAPYFVKFVE